MLRATMAVCEVLPPTSRHKPGKYALLELQHVGGRQVVRHQHQGHVHRVVQQQVLLRLAPLAHGGATGLATPFM